MECGGTGKNRWWSPTLPTLPLLDHTEPYNWVGTLVGQFETHSSTTFSHKSVFRSAYVSSHDNRSLSIIELMSMNILSLIAKKVIFRSAQVLCHSD